MWGAVLSFLLFFLSNPARHFYPPGRTEKKNKNALTLVFLSKSFVGSCPPPFPQNYPPHEPGRISNPAKALLGSLINRLSPSDRPRLMAYCHRLIAATTALGVAGVIRAGLPLRCDSVLLSTACPTSLASDQTKRGGLAGCTENTEVRCPRVKDSI